MSTKQIICNISKQDDSQKQTNDHKDSRHCSDNDLCFDGLEDDFQEYQKNAAISGEPGPQVCSGRALVSQQLKHTR